jgi:hypothetical protein
MPLSFFDYKNRTVPTAPTTAARAILVSCCSGGIIEDFKKTIFLVIQCKSPRILSELGAGSKQSLKLNAGLKLGMIEGLNRTRHLMMRGSAT